MRATDGPRIWLLAESLVVLVMARISLRVIPVSRILAWQSRSVPSAGPQAGAAGPQARQRELVAWAVDVTSRRSPIRFVCFPRCLAASFMLRARGVESRLHYGVAREGGKLVTHTWLESGGEVLVGGEVKAAYATLAVY
jgi:hypothetical protein